MEGGDAPAPAAATTHANADEHHSSTLPPEKQPKVQASSRSSTFNSSMLIDHGEANVGRKSVESSVDLTHYFVRYFISSANNQASIGCHSADLAGQYAKTVLIRLMFVDRTARHDQTLENAIFLPHARQRFPEADCPNGLCRRLGYTDYMYLHVCAQLLVSSFLNIYMCSKLWQRTELTNTQWEYLACSSLYSVS